MSVHSVSFAAPMNSVPDDILTYIGFPHSEISGSTVMCTSPKLIAAYHVLHRRLMPRPKSYTHTSLPVITTVVLYTTVQSVIGQIFDRFVAGFPHAIRSDIMTHHSLMNSLVSNIRTA